MKVNTAVFSLKGLTIKDNGLFAAFLSVLAGLISGSMVYATFIHKNNNPIVDIFISFNTEFIGKADAELFSGITVSVLIYFLMLFISGSSLFGRPMCVVITFFKFAGIGALISYLYIAYGLKGLEYVLLVFFPGKLILIFTSVLMSRSSFEMSGIVKNGTNEKGSTTLSMRLYYLKSLVYLLMFIVSAAIDFLMIKIFSSLFNFSSI